MKQKKANPWLLHVKQCRELKENKGKSLKEILKVAKVTYKKK